MPHAVFETSVAALARILSPAFPPPLPRLALRHKPQPRKATQKRGILLCDGGGGDRRR